MKKLIVIFGFVYLNAIDTKEILKEIEILKNLDFSYQEVNNIYNPFVKENSITQENFQLPKIEVEEEKVEYNLEVIFQNKAKINNNWYKNGDKLDGYIIIIRNNKVYLKDNDNNKLIPLNKKSLIRVK